MPYLSLNSFFAILSSLFLKIPALLSAAFPFKSTAVEAAVGGRFAITFVFTLSICTLSNEMPSVSETI